MKPVLIKWVDIVSWSGWNDELIERLVAPGDVLILITYAFMDIEDAKVFKPSLVFPDEATNLLK